VPPSGRAIGSSNSLAQPRSLMTAALPEVHNCASRHPRRCISIRLVTPRTRRAGAATVAGVYAFPRLMRVALANPAAILAEGAFH
jgi:hypothetical protein